MNILVTGCAGFIGFHLCKRLIKNPKYKVIGIDNINNYYNPNIKRSRLALLKIYTNFIFKKQNIENNKSLENFFKKKKIDIIINLAAQAGVRHSIKNPRTYLNSNIVGFFNVLELSKIKKIKHLIFASTSSVYGDVKSSLVKESHNTDKPLSFYAATKKSNEVMAYSYSNLHKIPITGLRFFTVYGPYGRPDMSLYKFVKNMFNKKRIDVFNMGNHQRDFTYVEDVVEYIIRIMLSPPNQKVPFEIYNISGNKTVELKNFIKKIENTLNVKAKKNYLPLQNADVKKSSANINKIIKKTKYRSKIGIEIGIKNFVRWFQDFYKIK